MEKPVISFETERLYARPVKESDKESYMDLRVKTSDLAAAYKEFPEFRDHEWDGELNSQNELYVCVFMKNTETLVAIASFQNFDTDTIEFGFDVAEEWRSQGIATELVQGMLKVMRSEYPGKEAKIRTNKENGACRKVAEKCGGVLSGFEPTLAARAIEQLMNSFGNKPTEDLGYEIAWCIEAP